MAVHNAWRFIKYILQPQPRNPLFKRVPALAGASLPLSLFIPRENRLFGVGREKGEEKKRKKRRRRRQNETGRGKEKINAGFNPSVPPSLRAIFTRVHNAPSKCMQITNFKTTKATARALPPLNLVARRVVYDCRAVYTVHGGVTLAASAENSSSKEEIAFAAENCATYDTIVK